MGTVSGFYITDTDAYFKDHPEQKEVIAGAPAAEEEENTIEYPDYSGVWSAMSEAQKEANAIANAQLAVSEKMLGISAKQAAIAEERYNYWKTNFMPLEQELIQKAKVGIDAEYAADVAGNRVGQAFKAAEGVGERYFERLGISEDDPRLASLTSDMQFARRAAEAGAKNTARGNAIDTTKNMRTAIAAMGRGMSSDSLNAFGNSARSLGLSAASAGAAGEAQFTGASGVAAAQLAGINSALSNNIGNAEATSDYNQFLMERSFQQDIDKANAQAMGWNTLGSLGSTALTAWGMSGGFNGGAATGGGNLGWGESAGTNPLGSGSGWGTPLW